VSHGEVAAKPNNTVTVRSRSVILRGRTTGDVTEWPKAQIDVLNAAYSSSSGESTGVEFVLASVDRTVNKKWSTIRIGNRAERDMKAALRVGGPETLNIYTGVLSRWLLGWSTFPWEYASDPTYDGVVILNSSLPGGTAAPYNEGDTATHEIGHWLGLPRSRRLSRARRSGRRHLEASPAYGCPTGRDTCTDPGLDPITNFMDYSDDACMFAFTGGQAVRIGEAWSAYRAA
jgi:hypothetical protein